MIDDHSPLPAHAQPQRRRLLWVLAAGLLLWALPMLLLLGLWGWHATLTQMAAFFTRAALLTFCGAYAVLPYVPVSYTTPTLPTNRAVCILV